MQAFEGYFENGQLYVIGQTAHIKGRRRAIINILNDESIEPLTCSQRQLAAFRRFVEINKAITDELIDEEFDEILSRGINVRELDL